MVNEPGAEEKSLRDLQCKNGDNSLSGVLQKALLNALRVKCSCQISLLIMVSMLASSAECPGFDPRQCQTKDNKIGICCFCTKNAAFNRSKSKDWST